MGGSLHPIYRFSSIGRPIDFRYPTNVAVAALSGLALLGGAALSAARGEPLLGIGVGAGTAAATVFLSWALGREIAPDEQAAAFVGVALAVAAHLLVGPPDLWWLAGTVGLARLLSRSVGPPAKITDSIMMVGLVSVLAFRGYSLLGALAALALGLDAVLAAPHRRHFVFAAGALAATVAALVLESPAITTAVPRWIIAAMGATAIVGALALPTPRSTADLIDAPLDHARVRAALLLSALCATAAAMTADHLAGVAVLFGPITVAALYALFRRVSPAS